VKLAKVRADDVVHVVDLDNEERLVCGRNPRRSVFAFIDDLSIGCPECRTFIVDWLLGRGVGREARRLVQDDVDRQTCDCPNIPVHPRSAHGASGTGHGASEGDPSL
jgi:hypothetical protein